MNPPVETERRGSGRSATRRTAHVERRDSPGAGFEASVIEVGPLGLCFTCRESLARGDALYIELYPASPAGPTYALRGIVRHAQRAGGEWRVGVQLSAGLPTQEGALPHEAARKQIDALRTALACMEATETSRLMFQPAEAAAPPPALEAAPRTARRRWSAWLALLLLLLLAGGTAFILPRLPWQPWQRSHHTARHQPPPPEPIAYAPPAGSTSRGWDALENPAVLESLEPLPALIEATPADTFVSAYLRARIALAQGNVDMARVESEPLRELLEQNAAPEAWKAKGEELVAKLDAPVDSAPLPSPTPTIAMQPEPIDPASESQQNESPEEASGDEPDRGSRFRELFLQNLWLDIDTGEHTLTLCQGRQRVRSFPVGLGARGATPLGDFRIANRIHHPDWYNHGNVVPHGDAANPLGDYWLGLSTPGVAQGIGIHPTTDTSSIGANESRGCIRMFPDDAHHLFSLCDVGTRVVIHE